MEQGASHRTRQMVTGRCAALIKHSLLVYYAVTKLKLYHV